MVESNFNDALDLVHEHPFELDPVVIREIVAEIVTHRESGEDVVMSPYPQLLLMADRLCGGGW